MKIEQQSNRTAAQQLIWETNIFIILKLLLYCSTALLLYSNLSFASQVDDEVLRIQKAYENITDIRGEFVQKSHIKDLKRTDIYTGRFFIKPPKMRWEFTGDNPQTVFINRDHIIIYQIKEKQAFQTKFDRDLYGQAPIALLGGFGNIKNEFTITSKTNDTLILKPRVPIGNVSYIEIVMSDGEFPIFPIQALTIVDNLSNTVEIHLENVRINTGIKDRIFEFSPPEGVRVLRR